MKLYYETELGKLYCGDAKDTLDVVERDSVDLLFTDPPYPRKYFHTYEYLAEFAPHVLMEGGSLVPIIPHYNVPEVLGLFKPPLKYRWMLHMSQFNGRRAHLPGLGIEVTFKIMPWYVKVKWPKERWCGWIMDGIKLDGKIEKDLHIWQQPEYWASYYVGKLSKEGQLVFDPYAGAGTVPLVCEKLNRKWIGMEIEEATCETVARRIDGYRQEKDNSIQS